MRLQLTGIGQALVFHFLLTQFVLLPGHGGTLVTADMNVRIGEDVHQFAQYVFGKLYGLGVGHVEYVGRNAPGNPVLVQAVGGAAEFRIGCHGGYEMSGHVNLGQHLDMTFAGVGYDVAHFLLRIEVGAVGLVGVNMVFLIPFPLIGVGSNAAY